MDFLATRPLEISSMALDGLSSRQKIISSNIANANTPGYQRTDVHFEDQLASMIQKDDNLNQVRAKYMAANSSTGMNYTVPSLEQLSMKGKDIDFSKVNPYQGYQPEVVDDTSMPMTSDGNNVNIESEMGELAKNGTKYEVITELQSRIFATLDTELKGL